MNTAQQPNEETEAMNALFDSLSTPRTMPGGWDLSALMAPGQARRNGGAGTAGSPVDAAGCPPSAGEADQTQPARFPEPNTLPRRWDLSG